MVVFVYCYRVLITEDILLSLTYFYAKQGIKIIPNIRCGEDELNSEFFKAIPKKELIAIGTHGFIKEKHQNQIGIAQLKR